MREHTIFPLICLCLVIFAMQPCTANAHDIVGPPFVFKSESTTAGIGETKCVEFTVENFEDVVAFQFGVTIDLSKLNFVEVISDILPETELFADLPVTGDPIVTVGYSSLNFTPLSLSDNTVLFTLCFEVLADLGGCSPLEFSELPGQAQGAQISVATPQQEYFSDNIIFENGEICNDGLQTQITTFDASNTGTATGTIQMQLQGGFPPYTVNIIDCNTNEMIYTTNGSHQNFIVDELLSGNYCIEIIDSFDPPNVVTSTEQIGSCNIPILIGFDKTEISCPGEIDGAMECMTEPTTIPVNTFIWSNGSQTFSGNPVTNIPPGEYMVTISDAIGCSILEQVTLDPPLDFEIDLNNSFNIDPTCNGDTDGQIHVFVNGGTPPFQYALQDGTTVSSTEEGIFNDLSQGDYTVSVEDANGCEVETQSFTIATPSIIVQTIRETICEGETLEGHDSSGSFTDILTSAQGCDSIRTLILTVEVNDTTFADGIICEGEDYDGFTETGSYQYALPNLIGCDSIINLDLIVNEVFITTITDTICEGESFEGYLETGVYTDSYQTVNGCDSTRTIDLTVLPLTDSFCADTPTSDLLDLPSLTIYPNPASDLLYISNEKIFSDNIQIVTVNGKVVRQFDMQQNITIDISDFETGVYFIKVLNGIGTTRFVKQ